MNSSSTDLVARVLSCSNRQKSPEMEETLLSALSGISALPSEEKLKCVQHIADQFGKIHSSWCMGCLVAWMGAEVARGIPPALTWAAVRGAFVDWAWRLTPGSGESAVMRLTTHPSVIEVFKKLNWFAEFEPDSPGIAALDLICHGVLSHLATAPEISEKATLDPSLRDSIAAAAPFCRGARLLKELLNLTSGRLTLLHAGTRSGYVITYRNVSNCYHLFSLIQSLLQDVVPESNEFFLPYEDSYALTDCLHGMDEPWVHTIEDAAWWHYGRPDRSGPQEATGIQGHESPGNIPVVNGTQVMVLWPVTSGWKQWSSRYFHPKISWALPEANLESGLPPDEVEKWWNRLRLPLDYKPQALG